MNKKRLIDFVSLKDLPLAEEIYGNESFLKVYHAILLKDKNNARELMARHLGRKPMSVKKKLKSIIKDYNYRCLWRCDYIIPIKNIEDLEERLLNFTLEY